MTTIINKKQIHPAKPKRMSFVFPPEFYAMLLNLKEKYGKDMTYIVMEAVNEYVMSRENLVLIEDESVLNKINSGNNGGMEIVVDNDDFKIGRLGGR